MNTRGRAVRGESTGAGPDHQRIWQLKLLAEARGYDQPVKLRGLLSDPAQLSRLLDWAETQPDPALRDLALEIRAPAERAAPAVARGATIRNLGLVAAGLSVVLLALVFWLGRGTGPRGSPVQPVQPVLAEDASRDAVVPVAQREVFRLHGSNTVGEELAPALVTAWLEAEGAAKVDVRPGNSPVERDFIGRFPDRGEDWRIELHAHGSSTAFADLAAGKADAGMSSRRIKPAEVQALSPDFGDLSGPASEWVVGLDGLAVIVHRSNPVQSLTRTQVAGIFAGRVRDWAEVGGTPGPIELHARDDNSGTFDTFKTLVLDAEDVKLAPGARRYESSTELSDRVAAAPAAIGFIGLPYVRNARALGVAESAETLPILPTSFTVGTEDYPLSRRLYLYAPARPASRELMSFLEFADSDAGQAVVKAVGLVSQNIAAERPRRDPKMPADYLALTHDAQRLSLNFRFVSGSGQLDNKAQRDLGRLVEFLAREPGRETLLLGFTDSIGDPAVNQALSLQRARGIEAQLQARGVFARQVAGFGPALPVASNATAAGRDRNRRVEVWVR